MSVPQHEEIAEITFKGGIIAIFLTIILASSNAYLGLKVGMTISSSIPAAVISMGVLRCFKNYSILENNIVQTAVSSGGGLTAGIIFTIPALLVIHYWQQFNYLTIVLISIFGGALGVLFSIPLRRVLLDDPALKFPEGTAIGNVLKATAMQVSSSRTLINAAGVGAFISLLQTGFKIIAEGVSFWFKAGSSIVGFGFGFNPALIGAGYIIGVNVALSIFAGIIIGWIIGIPMIAALYPHPATETTAELAMFIWQDYIRYMGLGVMLMGGLSAVLALLKPMYLGIKASFKSYSHIKLHGIEAIPVHERDIPIAYGLVIILVMLVPIYFGVFYLFSDPVLDLGLSAKLGFSFINLIYIAIGGLVLSSICAYFAGLVGSSSSPLSSLSLIALVLCALLTGFLLKQQLDSAEVSKHAAAIVIMITAFISATASISNDTLQDLKAGQIVGATPWKQQVMLIFGCMVAALIIPLVLNLLFDAYGMAGVFPREGMDPSQMLLAPQASLMAALLAGVFTGDTNWTMMIIGMVIALVCILIEKFGMRRGWRFPVLAVGLGVYLPVETSSSLVIGGCLAYIFERKLTKNTKSLPNDTAKQKYDTCKQNALLQASGLVAGAAIMGVCLAIPFVIEGSSNALRILSEKYLIASQFLGCATLIGLFTWFIKAAQVED